MKLGLSLPHLGRDATPEKLVDFARRTESLGFDSLWVLERLLRPVSSKNAPAGKFAMTGLPEYYGNVFDPIETLTYVAAHTSTISLGTSVMNALFHTPVVLARRLSTLDHFSGGRVIVGLGTGLVSRGVRNGQCVDAPARQRFRRVHRGAVGCLGSRSGEP
jgi:alkanesulfonate monooxygenase SsuD/methylene tetrahydromethanopterin reductase-like flavin-dependent oxidoreductase (luciferase family)